MGLNFADVRNLIEWRAGKKGGTAITLGRLSLNLHPDDLVSLRPLLSERAADWIASYKWAAYADGFFTRVLGFDRVESMDFSNYEGATILHDIGAPIPTALEAQFDLVIDGGTLEHIFNFPVALSNLMQLARVGGAVYTQSPCNNMAGHGFYQISPELMFRAFSEANGFQPIFVRLAVADNLSIEQTTNLPVYEVIDPAKVGARVQLMSKTPVVMMSMARRTANVMPFEKPMMQSDYIAKWDSAPPELNWKGRLLERLKGAKTRKWILLFQGWQDRKFASVQNSTHFTRLW